MATDLLEFSDKVGQPYLRVGGDKPEGFINLEDWAKWDGEGEFDYGPHGFFITGNSGWEWKQPFRAWLPVPATEGYHVSIVSDHYLDRYVWEKG